MSKRWNQLLRKSLKYKYKPLQSNLNSLLNWLSYDSNENDFLHLLPDIRIVNVEFSLLSGDFHIIASSNFDLLNTISNINGAILNCFDSPFSFIVEHNTLIVYKQLNKPNHADLILRIKVVWKPKHSITTFTYNTNVIPIISPIGGYGVVPLSSSSKQKTDIQIKVKYMIEI